MKKNLLAGMISGLFLAAISSSSWAFDAFVVKDIRVEGIQRTEAGTVFSYLPVKVGDTLNDDKASQALKALFATGFFKDVRIEIEGDVMVVIVEERPAIAQIDFVGLKEFDKDQLKKGLKDIGLAESRIFDRSVLDKAEQELKRQYLSRGKYAVQITTTVTPLERNRVGINFTVDEGESAKIKQINIIGGQSFPEKELLAQFQLTTPTWLSWYTKNDQYSRQKLQADQETLKSFYLNRGFLEFSIESTQVSISPDKKDVYITMTVNEGERYAVSSVKLAGDLILSEEELRKLVTIRPGDVFSRERVNESTKAVAEKLGVMGYAFANVNAAPELDKEKHLVSFTLFVDPGKRVYVRRINIGGNSRTRDEVIRQEMRQMEGAWYDADKITLSKQRIDKTAYFQSVNVETPAVPGTSDQVDVNVTVEEKPTGAIMLGAGYSSSDKLVLSGSVTQANVFGSGKTISTQMNSGSVNKTYSFSYTDPYFTVDGVSQGFDIYRRNVDPSSLSIGNYRTSTLGAGLRFGFPIGEKESLNLGVTAEHIKVTTYDDSPKRFIDFVDSFGNSVSTTSATLGWAQDTKDSFIYPTTGGIQRLTGELAAPPGTLRYYRATYQLQRYVPLSKDFTLMLNGEAGVANGTGGKPLPFFKNFYAGGIGSVRGYDTASLGPRDVNSDGSQSDERLGGNKRFVANAELLFPLPATGLDKSVRLGVFVDGGQVWGKDQKASLSDLRYSTGLSVAWTSPVGPLRFSIAQPLNKQDGDRVQRFQFQMGTTF